MEVKFKILCFLTVISVTYGAFESKYMVSSCNVNLGEQIGGRLETDFALTYTPLMDCWTTVSVKTGKRIFLNFKRFDMEDTLNGVCVDSLNIYDGSSTSASQLTAEMCGSKPYVFNLTTSGTSVTVYFKSDNTANFRGFEILYLAYSSPPCTADEFACSNGVLCIDKTLECDGEDQCGDKSDESTCTAEDLASKQDQFPIGIIVGSVVGALVLILIIAVVVYKVYMYYYWKNWLERNQGRKYPWEENDDDLYRYPKTDKYQIHEIGKRGRMQPKVSEYFVQENRCYENTVAAEGFNHYLDEK